MVGQHDVCCKEQRLHHRYVLTTALHLLCELLRLCFQTRSAPASGCFASAAAAALHRHERVREYDRDKRRERSRSRSRSRSHSRDRRDRR
jgi:hypothetical protein